MVETMKKYLILAFSLLIASSIFASTLSKEIVEKVVKCLGKDFDSSVNLTEGRIGEDSQYWLSSKKLFNDTGWKPEITIDQGIKETVDWVKENMNNFENENLNFQLRA